MIVVLRIKPRSFHGASFLACYFTSFILFHFETAGPGDIVQWHKHLPGNCANIANKNQGSLLIVNQYVSEKNMQRDR